MYLMLILRRLSGAKMKNTYYSLLLSAESQCLKCVCLYCYNTECPHIGNQSARVAEWHTSRCYKCGMLWKNKRPLDYCDYFISCQIPRTKYFTIVRRYRKKTQLQELSEKIENLEKAIEKLYNK